ncbi:hypothetical protein OHU45_02985 [Streptomyces tubercidicus]|nr:hypothetical protein OG761_02810 [Streptomyces tubercidicus]WSX24435.1 hypothetical protein OG690_34530 [Streptomyces tubercidicus]
MTTPANPFPNDPDRHALWDMLLRRDAEGFTAGGAVHLLATPQETPLMNA